MKTFSYTVKDEVGIHARPAGLLVKQAKKYASRITISKEGKKAEANFRSPLRFGRCQTSVTGARHLESS